MCIGKIPLSAVENGFDRDKIQDRGTSLKGNELFLIKTKGLDQANRIEVREKGAGSRIGRGKRGRT